MDTPEPPLLFKICPAVAWNDAASRGIYQGSADDVRDGYIHLSAAHQLSRTLHDHFAGQTNLVLVAFDAAALGSDLRWEPSRSGELFPHLYGALRSSVALWICPIPDDDRKNFVIHLDRQ
jgi:uncharacterized protein (DUF952 family)